MDKYEVLREAKRELRKTVPVERGQSIRDFRVWRRRQETEDSSYYSHSDNPLEMEAIEM